METQTVNLVRDAYDALGALLTEWDEERPGMAGIRAMPEPKWRGDYRRMWGLLNDVEKAGGDIGADEWVALGRAHGYDPRGLGGYFAGDQTMAVQGARRVLTEAGHRFVQRWAADFDDD